MPRLSRFTPAARRLRPLAALCASSLLLLAVSCGDDGPTNPNGNNEKGYIAGFAFILEPEHTTQIKIEIFDAATEEKVSTVFPNDEGRFLSDPLDQGTYDVTASIELPGYFPGRVNNIAVVPNDTTAVEIAVQDTSRVQFSNLLPEENAQYVERRPVISGEFRSAGAGYRLNSFDLRMNGEPIRDAEITEIDPEHHAAFSYTPPVNLRPGWKEMRLSVFTQANNQSVVTWSFYILEGISRRVPSEYPTVQSAVIACNDGDTVLVAPGTHDANQITLNVDVVLLSESGPDQTTLRALDDRHFRIPGLDRRVTIKGFTLSGGRTPQSEPGGSILIDEAEVLIENCVFTDNQSGDRGGAVAVFDAYSRIHNCSFIANRGYRGGAVAIFDRATPEITNCVFIRNVGTNGLGGAIFVRAAAANVYSSTFYRNDAAQGSAIYLDFDPVPAFVSSDSNIYAENRADTGGGTIVFNSSQLSSNCDGFHRNVGLLIEGIGGAPEVNRMLDLAPEVDAMFCDAGAEDLHLQPGSPFNDNECQRGAYPPGCNP